MLLKEPQVKKTLRQILEKTRLRHKEFGIKAGWPHWTWRCIQTVKTGARATEMQSREMFDGDLMLDVSAVTELLNEENK